MSADEKTCDRDRNLLHGERKDRAEQTEGNANRQRKPGRRVLHDIRHQFETDAEADRRDEEPKEPASEKEKQDSQKKTDDWYRKSYGASVTTEEARGQRTLRELCVASRVKFIAQLRPHPKPSPPGEGTLSLFPQEGIRSAYRRQRRRRGMFIAPPPHRSKLRRSNMLLHYRAGCRS